MPMATFRTQGEQPYYVAVFFHGFGCRKLHCGVIVSRLCANNCQSEALETIGRSPMAQESLDGRLRP
jgi:hypothetical protein